MARDDVDCSKVVAELYVFLDGELTDDRRELVNRHLHDCSPCLEAFDFEAELRQVIAQRCRDEVPSHLRDRILNQLRSMPPPFPPARDGGGFPI